MAAAAAEEMEEKMVLQPLTYGYPLGYSAYPWGYNYPLTYHQPLTYKPVEYKPIEIKPIKYELPKIEPITYTYQPVEYKHVAKEYEIPVHTVEYEHVGSLCENV